MEAPMKYVVVYEQTPNNWAAYVPDLPGCIATGSTRDEVERLIHEGIEIYLDELRGDGILPPTPGTWTEIYEVAGASS